jgi:putative FmdB family regulatory protein
MPTYQYACPDCGSEFEKVQKFTDDPVKKCPKCSKRHVYRVVSKVAVTFKGSGWYITDSKSNNSAGTAGKDKDKAGESEAKTEPTTTTETTETKAPATEAASTESTTKEAKPDKAEKAEKKSKKKEN